MPITIRDVRRSDRPQWEVLWSRYNAFYGRCGSTALDSSITELTWKRFLDPAERVYCLVGVEADTVVGLAHYLFHRSTTRAEDVCYLHDLFTLEAWRGRHIGRALIEAVVDAARSAGSSRVYWQTKVDNHAARALYDKVADHGGFIVYVCDVK